MSTAQCCSEDINYNPKVERSFSYKRGAQLFNWTNDRNPIIPQIKDTSDIQSIFSRYPLIPYTGTTQQSGQQLLSFLINMMTLSTTHGSCIISQKKFAFGGKLAIVQNADNVFDFEEEVEDKAIKKEFAEFVKGIKLNASDIRTFSENLFVSYKGTGNAYFSVVMSETMGQKAVSFNYHNPTTVLYMIPEKGADTNWVAVSNDFTSLDKTPPTLYPVYPATHTRKTGEVVTMFHIKDSTEWYGRPDSMASLLYQYREFQDANYLIMESDNNFTGKVFIEIEDGDNEVDEPDANDPLADVITKFEKNFTQKGDDPLSIMFMTRPSGASQAYVHEFAPNTNEKFFDTTASINERKILISHSWSARLLGESKAAGLSTNLFTDELESKLPLLEGYQTLIESFINTALSEVCIFMGKEHYVKYNIKFRTPFNVIRDATQSDGSAREARAGKNMNKKYSTLDDGNTDNSL